MDNNDNILHVVHCFITSEFRFSNIPKLCLMKCQSTCVTRRKKCVCGGGGGVRQLYIFPPLLQKWGDCAPSPSPRIDAFHQKVEDVAYIINDPNTIKNLDILFFTYTTTELTTSILQMSPMNLWDATIFESNTISNNFSELNNSKVQLALNKLVFSISLFWFLVLKYAFYKRNLIYVNVWSLILYNHYRFDFALPPLFKRLRGPCFRYGRSSNLYVVKQVSSTANDIFVSIATVM